MQIKIKSFKKENLDFLIKVYNETTKKLNWNEFTEKQKKVILCDKNKNGKAFHKSLIENLTLVAHNNNSPVGFITIGKVKNSKVQLYFFYILPNKTGKGIGKKLYNELEKRAKIQEIKRIETHTSEFALPIYEKLGFKDTGIDPWSIKKDNGEIVVFNDHLMVKELK